MMVNDVDAKFANLIGDVAKKRASGAYPEEIEEYMAGILDSMDGDANQENSEVPLDEFAWVKRAHSLECFRNSDTKGSR